MVQQKYYRDSKIGSIYEGVFKKNCFGMTMSVSRANQNCCFWVLFMYVFEGTANIQLQTIANIIRSEYV